MGSEKRLRLKMNIWKSVSMGRIGEISEVDDREESIAWKKRWPRTEPCRGGVARTERQKRSHLR